jgi:predicted transcriptional regulator
MNFMRRRYRQIRKEILTALSKGPRSTNEIRREAKCTWLTARRHLEYLQFKNKVELMISKPRWKLYRLKAQVR